MYVSDKYGRKDLECRRRTHPNYTKPRQIVFDPFAGSGVVAIEVARNKRRAIVCDLNPVASQIMELTLRRSTRQIPPSLRARARASARKTSAELYTVHCFKCDKPLVADCYVREGHKLVEIRYKDVPLRASLRKGCNRKRKTSKPLSNSK